MLLVITADETGIQGREKARSESGGDRQCAPAPSH
jgi:hypothetical protein